MALFSIRMKGRRGRQGSWCEDRFEISMCIFSTKDAHLSPLMPHENTYD